MLTSVRYISFFFVNNFSSSVSSTVSCDSDNALSDYDNMLSPRYQFLVLHVARSRGKLLLNTYELRHNPVLNTMVTVEISCHEKKKGNECDRYHE